MKNNKNIKKTKLNPLDQSDQIYILKNFQDQLLNNIVLRGIKNINKVVMRKVKDDLVEKGGAYIKQDIWVLDTIGTNLLDILGLDFIDNTRTTSNDIIETYRKVIDKETLKYYVFYYNHLGEVGNPNEMSVSRLFRCVKVLSYTDEWFYVMIDDKKYWCDQVDGVIQCVKDSINREVYDRYIKENNQYYKQVDNYYDFPSKDIQLKDIDSNTVTIYFTHSISVYQNSKGDTIILDGLHNNGGWVIPKVYHTHKQILEIIDDVIRGVEYKWKDE